MINRFLLLSETLTGESPLNRQLAAEYLPRVLEMPQGTHLSALLNAFDASVAASDNMELEIAARIMNNNELRGLAKVIILPTRRSPNGPSATLGDAGNSHQSLRSALSKTGP